MNSIPRMCELNKRGIVAMGDKYRPRVLDRDVYDGRIQIFISATDQQIIFIQHVIVQSITLTQSHMMCVSRLVTHSIAKFMAASIFSIIIISHE